MTRISIVVPDDSVLPHGIAGLYKVFDLANQIGAHNRGFELHFVGTTELVELYGGKFALKPDLTLAEARVADFVLIPAMAGNVADAIEKNSALVPWLQEQYRNGAEISGLCTGAMLLTGAGLPQGKHCVPRWYVDGKFREQYSHINSLAEGAALDGESIKSDCGAWHFFRRLIHSFAGEQAATACTVAFQEPFNRECQSIVSVSDSRKVANRYQTDSTRSTNKGIPPEIRLINRTIGTSVADLFEESLRVPHQATPTRASSARSQQDRVSTAKAIKGFLNQIERTNVS